MTHITHKDTISICHSIYFLGAQFSVDSTPPVGIELFCAV